MVHGVILDTFFFLLIISSATLLGFRVVSFLPVSWAGSLDYILNAVAIGLISFSILMAMAGLTGIMTWWFGWLLIIVGTLSGLPFVRPFLATMPPLSFSSFKQINIAVYGILCIALGINFLTALAPLYGGSGSDDVAYQFLVPKVYAAYQGFELVSENVRAYFPMNLNMLYALAALLSSPETAQLLNFFMGVATAGVTYVLASKYVNPAAAPLAMLLFYINPLVSFTTDGALINLGLTFFYLLALFSLLKWHDTREGIWFVFAGIYMGFLVGSQYLGLLYCATLLPLIVSRLKDITLRTLLTAGGIGLALSLPWYMKNWLLTGDPMFYMNTSWIADEFLVELAATSTVLGSEDNTSLTGFALVLWDLTMKGNWYAFWGGMGHLVLVYIPIYIFTEIRNGNSALNYMLLSMLLCITFWYWMHGSTNRYLIITTPLTAVIVVAILRRAQHVLTRSVHGITLLVYIGFGFMVSLKENSADAGYIMQPLSKTDYLNERVFYHEACTYLNGLDDPAKVFITGPIFPIYLDIPSIGPYRKAYSPFQPDIDNTMWLQTPISEFKQQGITHIIDGTGRFLTLREEINDNQWFQEVFTSENCNVFKIHYP